MALYRIDVELGKFPMEIQAVSSTEGLEY